MDHDSSRVLQEIRENSAVMNVLSEIFTAEATEEIERSSSASLENKPHLAVVHAARAKAFSSAIDIIAGYGKNDNG